jgi:hypothetical protein
MSTQAPYDEKDLLERVAAGDETAFRKLFHQYWDNIYGVARMLTKSPFVRKLYKLSLHHPIALKTKAILEARFFY